MTRRIACAKILRVFLVALDWTTDKNGFNERVREISFTPKRVKAALE